MEVSIPVFVPQTLMSSFVTSSFLASFAVALTAQTGVVQRKLSGPMSTGVTGDVASFYFSPAGDRVVYAVTRGTEVSGSGGPTHLEVASSDGSGVAISLSPEEPSIEPMGWTSDASRFVFVVTMGDEHEIHSVPTDGSAAPTVLFAATAEADLASNPAAEDVELTTDGSHAVYLQESDLTVELYGVPVAGGAAIRLNGTLASGGNVADFLVSGETVVYRAEEVNGRVDVFAVPADGSAPRINLSHSAAPAESVLAGFTADPSGTRAVYLAVQNGSRRLFSVPVDGSAAPVPLSPAMASLREVTSFRVSPDASRVVYRADPGVNDRYELFVAPIDGSAPAAPLVTVGPGGVVWEDEYRFSPDGAYVVYHADDGDQLGFFSVRLSDGAIVLLHLAPVVAGFEIAPNSARAVFLSAGLRELYSARLDGSTPSVRINPDFVPGGRVDTVRFSDGGFAISPDSLRVAYRADAEEQFVWELYRVPIVPSGPPIATKLNPPLPAGADVGAFRIAPSSPFVLYQADAETPGVTELLRTPGQFAINGALPIGAVGDVLSYVVRNGRVVYLADQEADECRELFGAPADGSTPPVKLNGVLVEGGDVTDFALTSDGSTAVYLADAELDETYELYTVAADGSAPPVRLNGPLHSALSVGGFLVSPDGTRVVYEAFQDGGPPTFRLWSVPIHGGTTVPFDMNSASFDSVQFTPDSTRVLFETSNHGVRSVPSDGSAPSILVSANDFVLEFRPTPDSARVVYRGIRISGRGGLFSVPVQGGPILDLTGEIVGFGEVLEFAFGAGQRVVFRGDLTVDQRFLLWSVPVDGSSPRIALSAPLIPGGDVLAFQLSPDGVHAVYLADQEATGVERLHRVPVDGSSPAVVLSEDDLDTTPFAIAPDDAHVVLSLDGLQSLPTAGGELVRISSTKASPSEIVFPPGGRRVIYSEPGRLVVTPILGGSSVALSPELAGSVREVELDGASVVYRADQDEAEVVELYSSRLDLKPAEHAPPATSRSVTR